MQTEKYLSNIDLYYSEKIHANFFELSGDEFKHAAKVMRHLPGDEIFATDGKGKIFRGKIIEVFKDFLKAEIDEVFSYKNNFSSVFFCIPKLKNPDRFEFALEKCVELGITNFIIFSSKRSVSKGSKPERWNRILLSAMKQSLRSYLPVIEEKEIKEIAEQKGELILLDQKAGKKLSDFNFDLEKKYIFVFGPEGGLADEEISLLKNAELFHLTSNRLRSETAIAAAASIISSR